MRRRSLRVRILKWFSKRSSRRKVGLFTRITIFILTPFVIVFIVLHLPIISFQSVEISEDSDINEVLKKEIKEHTESLLEEYYRYIIPGSTKYFFNRGELKNILQENFLQARDVEIENIFFNKLTLGVMKREIFGRSCSEERCLLIDVDGFVYGESKNIKIGENIVFSGDLDIGDYIFDTRDEDGKINKLGAESFRKVNGILQILRENGFSIEKVEMKKDSFDVYILLENGIGIWVSADKNLYDTTKAIHVLFNEVFTDEDERNNIKIIDICDPLQLFHTSEDIVITGCKN